MAPLPQQRRLGTHSLDGSQPLLAVTRSKLQLLLLSQPTRPSTRTGQPTYTVTFDPTEGSVSPPSKTVTYDQEYGTLPDPTRTGYTFDGWYTAADGQGSKVEDTIIVKITADQTLYAKWNINSYNVVFDLDNGESTQTNILNYNDPIVYPTGFVKEGYTFNGWDMIVENVPANDLKITAQWTINTYKVLFTIIEESSFKEEYVVYNEPIPYPQDFEREGYTFTGWDKDNVLMPAYDLNITAGWKINTYTIAFDHNDGKHIEYFEYTYMDPVTYPKEYFKMGYSFLEWDLYIEFMPARNLTITIKWVINEYKLFVDFVNGTDPLIKYVPYNEAFELPTDVKRDGYDFVSWSSDVRVMPPNNLAITAEWSIKIYQLTLDFNNGTEPEISFVTFGDVIYYPEEMYREGYTFDEWEYDHVYMPGMDFKNTAKWIINSYTVTFDFDNGTVLEVVQNYNDTIIYPPNPTKEGWKFFRWNKNLEYVPASNVTITAQWATKIFFVTFDPDNGDPCSTSELRFEDPIDFPTEITKEGYTLSGWDTTETTMPARNFTTKAIWSINSYSVVFDLDNGETPVEKIYEFNELIEYPEPTKEGHTFLEWSEAPTNMPARNFTIKATWSVNSYSVVFDFDNGETPVEKIYEFNELIEYPEPTKEGHTFLEWSEAPTNMPARNFTIKATWSVNSYDLTFEFDNGTEPSVATVSYGQEIEYPEATKEGHTFLKWSEDLKTMPAHDLTIVAQWSVNNYTIEFVISAGNVVKSVYNFGDNITYPKDLELEGHTFDGWDVEGVATMPATDLVITAKWTINEYAVTFDYGNGTVSKESVKFGNTIAYPVEIVNDYRLIWSPNPKTMPAKDFSASATWVDADRFVDIIFGSANISDSDIEEALNGYANGEYTIDSITRNEKDDTTHVVIILPYSDKASEFVNKVQGAIDNGDEKDIVSVSSKKSASYSAGIYPLFAGIFALTLF